MDRSKLRRLPARIRAPLIALVIAIPLIVVALPAVFSGKSAVAADQVGGKPSATARHSRSGAPMPVGDIPGWKQIFTEDFDTDSPVGGFPGDAYSLKWLTYPDGWPDTFAKNGGGNGRYFPSKVIRVNNGILSMNLHTEGGIHMVAAPVPKIGPTGSQTYGRYSVRFRADEVPGYKTAFLLWPDSERWPDDGEIDFPEGDLTAQIEAWSHHASSQGGRDGFWNGGRFRNWHTATIEWLPTGVRFILDDHVLGTSTENVPSTPMHWVLQTETCLIAECQPNDTDRGNVHV